MDTSRLCLSDEILAEIVSLTLVFGLPVLRSFGPEETARLLVYAARQLRRHPADVHLRHGARPRTKRRMQLKILPCRRLPWAGHSSVALQAAGAARDAMTTKDVEHYLEFFAERLV
jgi:ERCC4-type nuclease